MLSHFMMAVRWLFFLSAVTTMSTAFSPHIMRTKFAPFVVSWNQKGDNRESEKARGFWQRLDDTLDDFFYKRMGNGEIFYGRRKTNPSGRVEGTYNGFGMTDKLRIDQTRELKEIWLEEKRRKEGDGESGQE